MKKVGVIKPLRNTVFPNRDLIQSFTELSRNYLSNMLDNSSLPHNRVVRVSYNDGVVTSNDICLAMMHSCRSFGVVAIIEPELNYLTYTYSDVVKLTYNRVMSKNLEIELANPIKSIIVKDYEMIKNIHGSRTEESIKLYIRELNFKYTNSEGEYFDTRTLYPCFFLVN